MNGIQSGGVAGNASAALNAGALANRYGAFTSGNGTSATAGGILGTAGGALGIYNGLQRGGLQGYGGATVGALQAGSGIASLAGNQALSATLGGAAGYIAAPLALYSAIKNWQSGSTGSDAINGAEAGAAIGSIIPGVGTAIGAVVGGAVGAVSSAFGGGKADPETTNWDSFVPAFNSNPQLAASLSPSQSFQMLAGVMDAKNNSAGSSEQLEQSFGRMGENGVVTGMATQINQAMANGSVPKNANADQLYSQVVQPWLASKGITIGQAGSLGDSNGKLGQAGGQNEGSALQGVITSLINQWQTGQLTSSSQVGVNGQTISGLASYQGEAPQGQVTYSTQYSPAAMGNGAGVGTVADNQMFDQMANMGYSLAQMAAV